MAMDSGLIGYVLAGLVAALVAALAAWLSAVLVRYLGRRYSSVLFRQLSTSCRWPWRLVLLLTAELIVLPRHGGLHRVLLLGLIAAGAWLTVRVLFVLENAAFRRIPLDVANNRRLRRARTTIGLLRRLTAVGVTIVAAGAILMMFTPWRVLGASLLASAGVIGVVAAVAAHTTLGNVFAGIQLAFTDTLRIDDVVVVEDEWGRIEDLRLTHVIVHLWDERRLVLPTTYFTTNPFQNWTRDESRVLGSVILHLDYTTPIAPLREEARRIIEASPLWAGREWALQVIDTTEKTMVIRVLADAADGPSAFDLRCEVREQLIEFVRENHPQGLPQTRITGPLDESAQ